MNKALQFVLLFFVTTLASFGQTVSFGDQTFKGGNNVIPFGNVGLIYQQVYDLGEFPNAKDEVIKAISFTSQTEGTFAASLNVIVRMAIVPFVSYYADNNLVGAQYVYVGPLSALLTGKKNDLSIELQQPFQISGRTGKLVVDILVISTNLGGVGFEFGASNTMSRLYQSLAAGNPLAFDNGGLRTEFTLTPAK